MSSCSDVMLSEEMKSLEQIIFAFFNAENHDSPRQGFQEIVPSFAPPEDHRKRLLRSTSFPPLANGKGRCARAHASGTPRDFPNSVCSGDVAQGLPGVFP